MAPPVWGRTLYFQGGFFRARRLFFFPRSDAGGRRANPLFQRGFFWRNLSIFTIFFPIVARSVAENPLFSSGDFCARATNLFAPCLRGPEASKPFISFGDLPGAFSGPRRIHLLSDSNSFSPGAGKPFIFKRGNFAALFCGFPSNCGGFFYSVFLSHFGGVVATACQSLPAHFRRDVFL